MMALLRLIITLLGCSVFAQGLRDKGMRWNPDNYTQGVANNTLMYAYGAYCSSASLLSWTCKWCQYIPNFKVDQVFDPYELQGFTGYDPDADQIVISFRGTSDVGNWLDDLDAIVVAYPGVPGGYVDKGFYAAYGRQSAQVMLSVQNLISMHPNSQILVTGHSLGAAVAQIAALDIFTYAQEANSTGYRLVQTFGSPRWCNEVMVEYFEGLVDMHWRLVNIKDIVPTVPPQDKYYHHTPTMVWYKTDVPLTYQICDSSGEDPSCEYIGYSIYDHLHYLDLYEDCGS